MEKDTETWYIEYKEHGKTVVDHKLCIDLDQKDLNNQLRSFYWFRQRERKRLSESLFKQCVVSKHCVIKLADDPLLAFSLSQRVQEVPVFEHSSVWEFYKAIGFDHQTRMYRNVDVERPWFYAYILEGDNIVAYHRFTLEPRTKVSDYRACRSYGAFASSTKKRNAPWEVVARDQDEMLGDLCFKWRALARANEPIENTPLYTHNSLWEFYRFIGWNFPRGTYEDGLRATYRKLHPQTPIGILDLEIFSVLKLIPNPTNDDIQLIFNGLRNRK